MEKAYDIKALGQKLKDAGLPLAEEQLEAQAGQAYVAIKQWLVESAALSENKIDDIVAGFYAQLDPIVLPLIASIDLDKDGK